MLPLGELRLWVNISLACGQPRQAFVSNPVRALAHVDQEQAQPLGVFLGWIFPFSEQSL